MYKFEVGDIANGVKTSEKYMEAIDYVAALERVVEDANLYVEGWDKEADDHIKRVSYAIDDEEEKITKKLIGVV